MLPRNGLCLEPWVVHGNGNSGAQAVGLAYHLGARTIALLAYDMQHTDGKRHFHDDYPAGWDNASPVQSWRWRFEILARDLELAGVELVNASRQTALSVRRVDLESVLGQ